MKKNKLLPLLILASFLFAACGEDDSPSASKNGQDDVSSLEDGAESTTFEEDEKKSSDSKAKSSSSFKEIVKSSSSTVKDDKKSSSSEMQVSSSSVKSSSEEISSSAEVVPENVRVAEFADLEKNYELKLFDQTVYLSTGSKQGLVALRIPGELWLVTYTDFANGKVKFAEDNVGKQYSETDAVKKILENLKDGFTISFVVDEKGNVKYAVNGAMIYQDALKASVAIQKDKVFKAETIQNNIYECFDGDTTRTFTFFDNSYILDVYAGEKLAYWVGGHYDIQRSTLLMLPVYFSQSDYSMYAYSVGTDDKISSTNGETTTSMDCNVEASEYEYEKAGDFVGEWQAKKDDIDWEFTLKADGTYELSAFEGSKKVEAKSGVWEVYGYHLMMRNTECLHPDRCTNGIHGQLQAGTFDPESGKISGFSFIHKDPDTPRIPTAFNALENE